MSKVKKLVIKKFRNLEKAHKAIRKANEAAAELGKRGHYQGNVEEQNEALKAGKLRVDTRPAQTRDSENTSDGVTE